jgi:hypothetical protein
MMMMMNNKRVSCDFSPWINFTVTGNRIASAFQAVEAGFATLFKKVYTVDQVKSDLENLGNSLQDLKNLVHINHGGDIINARNCFLVLDDLLYELALIQEDLNFWKTIPRPPDAPFSRLSQRLKFHELGVLKDVHAWLDKLKDLQLVPFLSPPPSP